MDNWDTASTQLFAELKIIFSEVPEEKICECIIQNSKDKEACIKFLTRINEDYLFGCQSPISARSIRGKFNKSCFNDELAEHNESKETFDSELDIFTPEETFRHLLNEEKKIFNVKNNSNQSVLQETENIGKVWQSQAAHGKSTVHSAPVISSASYPFELMDNENMLSASGQTKLPSKSDIGHLTQNNSFSKDVLKWNNNCGELAAQYSRQNFSRGYSYPVPDPLTIDRQNIPFSSFSQSSLYHYNHLKSKDYTTPLYVTVTSPQYSTSYMTSHPAVGLIPSSSNVQRHHSPISSNITVSFPSPLSAVLPPSSLSSGPYIPPFRYNSPLCPPHQQQSSTGNSSHSPNVTSSNLHYIYDHAIDHYLRERTGVMKKSQSTNPFQQQFELYSKQDFASRTYSPSLITTLEQYNSQYTHDRPSVLCNASQLEENEKDYIKALLPYQMNNYQLIIDELQRMMNLRYTLRMDVNSREQELSQIRQHQNFPNMEQIQKLKEEIIKLKVECDYLRMKFEFYVQGEESSNTIEESFYENIFTGPKGPIPPAPNNKMAPTQNSYAEHRDDDDQSNKWNCSKCTYANHPDLTVCEICESPRVMISNNIFCSSIIAQPCYCHKYRGHHSL